MYRCCGVNIIACAMQLDNGKQVWYHDERYTRGFECKIQSDTGRYRAITRERVGEETPEVLQVAVSLLVVLYTTIVRQIASIDQ
jgi:hypothetical protein